MHGNAVVVGVDGSEEATRALRWAAQAARQRQESLHIVHGFAPITGFDGAGLAVLQQAHDELVKTADDLVADAVRTAREAGGPDLTITTDRPTEAGAPALIEASRAARTVVLGCSGTGGFTGMLVGSTTVEVAAHAWCPVVVVRGRENADGPVVVGVDGSPVGERALAAAFEEASWRGAGLVAVHVWSDVDSGGHPSMVPVALDWEEIAADERRLLAERLAGWQEKYPDVVVERVVARDRPRHQLLSWSAQAQLVVVGSRGRGGFSGLLLGSTSQALIHHAQCPVMVVRPQAGS
ncbi:universal stress protein [Amycolatopsis methanolica]|uniref:Universal stress protein n=1 Tax=Amycolatopsis methanolica 239 TaxID=1068978 RepID=A0A076MVU9_AMYME|nr:universal stress protein [Amycolatopsis methanolica]AIJ23136.1 universal stress protein [Amycolatopsis methanolica 239]